MLHWNDEDVEDKIEGEMEDKIETDGDKEARIETEVMGDNTETDVEGRIETYVEGMIETDKDIWGSNDEDVDVEGIIETNKDIEDSNDGDKDVKIKGQKEDKQVVEGSNEKLSFVFVTIENLGNLEGRSNTEVDNENTNDLFDSDYDMVEESGDEDDDNVFDANVNNNVELSGEESEEEPM